MIVCFYQYYINYFSFLSITAFVMIVVVPFFFSLFGKYGVNFLFVLFLFCFLFYFIFCYSNNRLTFICTLSFFFSRSWLLSYRHYFLITKGCRLWFAFLNYFAALAITKALTLSHFYFHLFSRNIAINRNATYKKSVSLKSLESHCTLVTEHFKSKSAERCAYFVT